MEILVHNKQYILAFILTFIVIFSSIGKELKPRIAIIPFTAINIPESNAQTITGLFETAIAKTNVYTIIEQNQMTTNKFSFSLGTGLSYLSGQYREIVYTNAESENPYLSELLWNVDNILLLNFTGSISKGLWSLNLSLGTAMNQGNGIMEDYDWGDYTKKEWTNWSTSSIFLDKSVFIDINSSYKYKLNSFFSFPVKLGYKLNYLDWEDQAEKYIYYWYFKPEPGGYLPSVDTGDLGGVNGIDYMVIQNIFYASYGVYYTVKDISTGIDLALSPYINAWDLDHHILRNLFFIDTFNAYFWYRVDFSLDIKTGSNGKLVLSLFREELPEIEGDTFIYNEDTSNPEEIGTQVGYISGGAGMASILWGMGISYIWTF